MAKDKATKTSSKSSKKLAVRSSGVKSLKATRMERREAFRRELRIDIRGISLREMEMLSEHRKATPFLQRGQNIVLSIENPVEN